MEAWKASLQDFYSRIEIFEATGADVKLLLEAMEIIMMLDTKTDKLEDELEKREAKITNGVLAIGIPFDLNHSSHYDLFIKLLNVHKALNAE
jgi:hypothetical protein